MLIVPTAYCAKVETSIWCKNTGISLSVSFLIILFSACVCTFLLREIGTAETSSVLLLLFADPLVSKV